MRGGAGFPREFVPGRVFSRDLAGILAGFGFEWLLGAFMRLGRRKKFGKVTFLNSQNLITQNLPPPGKVATDCHYLLAQQGCIGGTTSPIIPPTNNPTFMALQTPSLTSIPNSFGDYNSQKSLHPTWGPW